MLIEEGRVDGLAARERFVGGWLHGPQSKYRRIRAALFAAYQQHLLVYPHPDAHPRRRRRHLSGDQPNALGEVRRLSARGRRGLPRLGVVDRADRGSAQSPARGSSPEGLQRPAARNVGGGDLRGGRRGASAVRGVGRLLSQAAGRRPPAHQRPIPPWGDRRGRRLRDGTVDPFRLSRAEAGPSMAVRLHEKPSPERRGGE